MKKLCIALVGILSLTSVFSQSIYKTKTTKIDFFSDGAIEDIAAETEKAKGVLSQAKNEFAVVIPMNSFKFEKPLMEEHFNENYVESDKYPTAMYKGKITGEVDWSKDGKYQVSTSGSLTIHGVEQKRDIPVTINIKGKEVIIDGKFIIKLEDHKVKIPKVVVKNIAEEVMCTIHLAMEPKTATK